MSKTLAERTGLRFTKRRPRTLPDPPYATPEYITIANSDGVTRTYRLDSDIRYVNLNGMGGAVVDGEVVWRDLEEVPND